MMISQQLNQKTFQEPTHGVLGSPVKTFPLQESNEDLMDQEVESILTYLTSSKAKKKKISPDGYSLRTLKTCYQSITDGDLPEFSLNWMKLGTTANGSCSTLKTSESLKTVKEYSLSDILETEVEEKYFLSDAATKNLNESGEVKESRHNMTKLEPRTDGISNTLTTVQKDNLLLVESVGVPKLIGGIGERNFGTQFRQGNRVYDSNSVAMCLNAQPVGNAGGNSYLYKVNYRIRKLTPKECFRLQGFPDEYFERAASVNSNSQLYKQAGNAVTVNVTYEIGKKLMEIEKGVIS